MVWFAAGGLFIVICPSTWLRVVVSLSNHLVFEICDLKLLIARVKLRQNGTVYS
jgi:hypothetical protein